MKILCKKCGWGVEFPDSEIRLLPVEKGDEQLFQIRDLKSGNVSELIFKCEKCKGIRGAIEGVIESKWSKETFVSQRVFHDPTPNGQINMRVVLAPVNLLCHTDMDEKEQEHFINILILCGKKLAAVWKHMRDYGLIEDKLIKAVEQGPPLGGGEHVHFEENEDLFMEVDEFLVQLKSSLDYLVKTPIPILGFKHWNLRTFGDKGQDVIGALRNNIPKDKKKQAEFIVKMIIETHQPWLTDVIDARDRMNHMIGEPIRSGEFMVFKFIKDGVEGRFQVPSARGTL